MWYNIVSTMMEAVKAANLVERLETLEDVQSDSPTFCPRCGGGGVLVTPDGDYVPCPLCVAATVQVDRGRALDRVDGWGLPGEGKLWTKLLRECLDFAESPAGRWLVLHGGPGSGKTTLAMALAEHLRRRRHHVVWRSCLDCPAWPLWAAEEWVGGLFGAQVLFLDDFGLEPNVTQVNNALARLVRFRHTRCLSTVFCVPVARESLLAYISSRLWDCKLSKVLTMPMTDYRRT